MKTTIQRLAEVCGATLLRGDGQATIDSADNIDAARDHQLSFITSAKYLCKLQQSRAAAVIVPTGVAAEPAGAAALLAADDPELAFIACLRHLYPPPTTRGEIHPQSYVDSTARLADGCWVDAFASIGERATLGRDCRIHAGVRIGADVRIGERCVLHPNVVLYHGVELGDDVVVHAGTVIGSDGFGYKFRNGEHVKFPQVGTVIIESNVEIGANTCIDRAALGATRVGEGTKIDNQVHIAHNVRIGARALLCGQVGIGGSSVIEDHAVLASQCGVADHVTVGKQAVVLAQAGVTKDISPQTQVMGFPAACRKETLHNMAALRKLAEEHKSIDELIRMLPRLRGTIG